MISRAGSRNTKVREGTLPLLLEMTGESEKSGISAQFRKALSKQDTHLKLLDLWKHSQRLKSFWKSHENRMSCEVECFSHPVMP